MPLSSVLFLKTHFVPMGLTSFGSGTSSHTCCLLNCWSSSCIASTQLLSFSGWDLKKIKSPWYGMMAFVGEGCKCVASELTTAGDFDDPVVASKGGGMGGIDVDHC
ncbi:hypothetical protein Hanom_Chr07g00620621 [Helianthus anomalus]